jgi:hypothetical protein
MFFRYAFKTGLSLLCLASGLCPFLSLQAQKFATPESFAQLDSAAIDPEWAVFAYFPKGSPRLDASVRLGDPFMEDEIVTPVARVQLGADVSSSYILSFTRFPSDDPSFMFFREKTRGQYDFVFSVAGKQLFLPGNGYLYTGGHANTFFDQKRKYRLEGDTVREIEQPLYAVGLKTRTLKPIKLFSDKTLRHELATVPARASVEVVAAEYSDQIQYFLVKTSFGLLGWWKLDNWFSEEIEGLFFAGD